ncbi:uncharacterized protein J3D65DRAFT_205084 [Phyllosticta citribraziliensis]|uniref:Tachykinin family protein n=1 Tax=Phyllosticta citribraziliensis TaxID=989973 RepID=A0ABR1M3M3_9PEZI
MSEFQFLTTSNPEDFKKGRFLKQIRSHAMLNVKQREQKQHNIVLRPTQHKRTDSATRPSRPSRSAQGVKVHKFVAQDPSTGKRKRKTFNEDEQGQKQRSKAVALTSKSPENIFARYVDAVQYSSSLRKNGVGLDPVNSMPEFSNPKISVWELKRRFDFLFVSDGMKRGWYPAMDGSASAFLSTAMIKSSYADISAGYVCESPMTMHIKEEIYYLMKKDFEDLRRRTDTGMFITIGQLLVSEVVQGEEKVMQIHETGLNWMVEQRGGFNVFGGHGVVSGAIIFIVYLSLITREGLPPGGIRSHLHRDISPIPVEEHVPVESPIYLPRKDFYTISPLCSELTLVILRDMAAMTDKFLSSWEVVQIGDSPPFLLEKADIGAELWLSHQRMLNMPVSTKTALGTNDYVYEACRHTAIVYSYALAAHIPFSVAGKHFEHTATTASNPSSSDFNDPSASPDSLDSHSTHLSLEPLNNDATHPSIAILAALQQTNLLNAWDDLVGVLLWIALVGATAGRASPSPYPCDACRATRADGPAARLDCRLAACRRDYHRARARKNLAMIAALCCIRLNFERGKWVFPPLRNFLRVQELLMGDLERVGAR